MHRKNAVSASLSTQTGPSAPNHTSGTTMYHSHIPGPADLGQVGVPQSAHGQSDLL